MSRESTALFLAVFVATVDRASPLMVIRIEETR
jgi:hypothetical protein